MTTCDECGQSGGAYSIPSVCAECMHRLKSELAYLEVIVKTLPQTVKMADLFSAGGIGHRLELLRARVYSWQSPEKRAKWLEEHQ